MGSRSHSEFFLENRPKIVRYTDLLICWGIVVIIPRLFCLCTLLLKVVSHYDMCVLSMSVMGFQKVFIFGVLVTLHSH